MPAYKDTQRGTWYVKYSTKDAVTGKRKQVLKRGFAQKRDALKWENSQKYKTETAVTLRNVSDKYFEYRNARKNTRDHQTAMLEKYVPFLDDRIDQISRAKVMDWYLDLGKEDLKPGTKNLILTVVKSIFRYGADFYELPNLASGLKRFREQKKEMSVWTPSEFKKFADSVDLLVYRYFFTFLYWTGCRKGEAQALQYTDFKDGKVHIWRQWTPQLEFSELKTDSSERTLKLSEPVQAVLKPLLERCDEEHPFVFGGKRPLAVATIQAVWKQGIASSGVRQIRIHDLRHSFATNMIASGANIVAVSKYLGHSSINMTLKTYTHLLQEKEDEMVSIINALSGEKQR